MSLFTGAQSTASFLSFVTVKTLTLQLSAPQFPVLAHVGKSSEPVDAVSTALERDTSVVIAGTYTNRCRKCKKKHHSSIREVLFPDRQRPTVQPGPVQQANTPSSQLNPDTPPYVATPTTSNLCSDNRKMILLLQTARAQVHNPSDPYRTLEVRLLLDGGSQRSYITDRVRKLLALEPSGEHRLSIAAFGSRREKYVQL